MTTVVSKPLFTSKEASTSETTQYTAPTGTRAIIDKFTAYNSTGASVALTVRLVPNGGTAGATHIVAVKSIAAGETYTFPEVVGHSLEIGGFISTIAAASGVNIRCTGREVS